MSRGRLRVYLGMAPGVGKTLRHARRGPTPAEPRAPTSSSGYVETHGRAHTAERLEGLEVVPRVRLSHGGTTFEEMDLDGVLAREPGGGAGRRARPQQHPRQSAREALGGRRCAPRRRHRRHHDGQHPAPRVAQRRGAADQRGRAAGDDPGRDRPACRPDRDRRHLARGAPPPDGPRQHLPAERVDAALSNYFRVGNLSALRELALLWVAERVDEGLQRYRAAHGIDQPWEARERIVVVAAGRPRGRDPAPPGRPHRRTDDRLGAAGGPCRRGRRPGRRRPDRARAATAPGGVDGRLVAPGRRATTSPSPSWTSPGRRTPPRSCWARAVGGASGVVPGRRGHRGPGDPAVGQGRRPPRHPRGGVVGPGPASPCP